MSRRKGLLQTTMLAGVVGAVFFLRTHAASAADLSSELPVKAPPSSFLPSYLPAVDGINWKTDGFGGTLANRTIGAWQGSLSVPLAGQYGVQVDGTAGTFDGNFFASAAGHWFWRNPTQGLLGLYVSHTYWDQLGGANATQVAVEGEYYWQRWTLQGIAGVEFGNSRSELTNGGAFTDTIDVRTRFYDKVNLNYYFTDNWKAFLGHRYLGGKHALALGSEVGIPISRGAMATAFVEGRVGESDFHGVWGGLRLYFGQKDKSLIARHRQDDPLNWDPDTLFTLTNQFNRTVNTKPKGPPPSQCPPGYIYIPGEGCIFNNPV